MAKRSLIKPRGYPDRRGMGAQSDFIVEQFVPSKQYKLQQMEMVQKLSAAGLSAEQIEKMFFISAELLSGDKGEEKPKHR